MGSKSEQLLTISAHRAAELLRQKGWKQKEYLSAGVIALLHCSAEEQLKFKELSCTEDMRVERIAAIKSVIGSVESTSYRVLSDQESKELDKLRELLLVDPKNARLTAAEIKARKGKRGPRSAEAG